MIPGKGNIPKDPAVLPKIKQSSPASFQGHFVPAVPRGKTLLCSSRIPWVFSFAMSLDGSGIEDDVDCGLVFL